MRRCRTSSTLPGSSRTRERDSVAPNLQLKPSEARSSTSAPLYIEGRFRQLQPVDVQLPLAAAPTRSTQLTVGSNGIVTGGHAGPNSSRVLRQQRARFRADDQRRGLAGCVTRRALDRCRGRSARARPTTISSSGSSSRPSPAASAGTSPQGYHVRRSGRGARSGELGAGRILRQPRHLRDRMPRTATRRPTSAWSSTACSTSCASACAATSTRRISRSTSSASLPGDLAQVGTIGLTDIEGFAPTIMGGTDT